MNATEIPDPPRTIFVTDAATILGVDSWIEKIHPAHCPGLLEKLARERNPNFRTVRLRLAAHCLSTHDAGIATLCLIAEEGRPQDTIPTGIADAVRVRSKSLLAEARKALFESKGAAPGFACLLLLIQSLDDRTFLRVWRRTWFGLPMAWSTGARARLAAMKNVTLRAAAFDPNRSQAAAELVARAPASVMEAVGSELVFVLIASRELRPLRDRVLETLSASEGMDVARAIVAHSYHRKDQPACLADAIARVLNDSESEELWKPAALMAISLNTEASLRYLVSAINEGKADHDIVFDVEHEMRSAGPVAKKRVYEALAADAIAKDEATQHRLAYGHIGLLGSVDPALEWLHNHAESPSAWVYIATLIRLLASRAYDKKWTESANQLLPIAKAVHSRHGKRPMEQVYRAHNLTDDRYERIDLLRAAGLARDTLHDPPPVDTDLLLSNLRAHPETLLALGESALLREVGQGILPAISPIYGSDLGKQRATVESNAKAGHLSGSDLDRQLRALDQMGEFRRVWEVRFGRLRAAGLRIPAEKLRENPDFWTEARIACALVDHYSSIKYEPGDLTGFGTRRPDFLLGSPEGEVVLEVVVIGTKPEEVLEGVHFIDQATPKKVLQSKLEDKVHDCVPDFERPIVIAIETSKPWEEERTLPGGLYGPEQIMFAVNPKDHTLLGEGTTRKVDWALFLSPRARCISAVAAIGAEYTMSDRLRGELCRPIEQPAYPLSEEARLRLRTALFGLRPPELVEAMIVIPTISREEAERLVDMGVDDPSFLAAGLVAYPPGCAVTQERFEELRREAARYGNLTRTGQVRYLSVSEGADLSPLSKHGIHTVDQLLAAKSVPPGFDPVLFDLLRQEADALKAKR